MAKRKRRDKELEALDRMMLNVLRARERERKRRREREEIWQDFFIDSDVGDEDDPYSTEQA